MPTYEFRCPAGHDFEKFFRKISDGSAELPCPECGALAQRRVSAGAGLLFKGSGFYITDYGKDGKGARKTAEAGAEPAPGGDKAKAADAASGEARPAATGEGQSGSSSTPATTDSTAKSSSNSSSGSSSSTGSKGSTGGSTGKPGGGT